MLLSIDIDENRFSEQKQGTVYKGIPAVANVECGAICLKENAQT